MKINLEKLNIVSSEYSFNEEEVIHSLKNICDKLRNRRLEIPFIFLNDIDNIINIIDCLEE